MTAFARLGSVGAVQNTLVETQPPINLAIWLRGRRPKMQILKTKPYSSSLSTLDVPSSPRPPWWQSVPGQVALSAGAFLLVLFARRPETFLNPQLWAEDGFIFFVQADEFGARALTFSWAGYHNFLLRLIAVVSSPLNAQLVPAAYVGISLLVLLAVLLALFSPRPTDSIVSG